MKRIIIAALCAFVLASALNAQEKKGVVTLSSKEFKTKVYDISQKNPEYLGNKPAIVDFYADWCGPCKMIAPSLEEIAKEYAGKLYVYKVNVDNCGEIAAAFKISAIPTLLFIPTDGEPLKTVGMINKGDIEANVAKIMQ